jgi:hypothetical protein
MEDGLGFKFWAGLAGFTLALGIVLLIVFLIFTRAFYAWGAFGTLVVIAVLLLGVAWIYDKRQQREAEKWED